MSEKQGELENEPENPTISCFLFLIFFYLIFYELTLV